MKNTMRNYMDFFWYNQIIIGKFVHLVRIRVYRRNTELTFYHNKKLVATNGEKVFKGKPSQRYLRNYSYAIFFNEIRKPSCPRFYLYINVFLSDDFVISMLDDENFLGKNYVIEAWNEVCQELTQNQK